MILSFFIQYVRIGWNSAHDVQYIPDLCTNLLSVIEIVKTGYKVVFQSSVCEIEGIQSFLTQMGIRLYVRTKYVI